MESAPPAFDSAAAEALALRLFGVNGAAKPLNSERDQNFLIRTGDSSDYVLKIANSAEPLATLELQNAALQHIAESDPELGVPHVCRGPGGRDIETVRGPDGLDHLVRLVSFLPGHVFASTEATPDLVRDLGTFMGRLNRALQGFHHPAAHRPDFLWNLDNPEAAFGLARHIADPDKRELVERWIARYRQDVTPRLKGLRWAAIHNDANDHNLVVSTEPPTRIAGLIDFGDMVWGRQINELAITLAYTLFDQSDLLAAACSLTAGYHAAFALQEDELAVAWDLAAARLVMSVCISSWRGRVYEENDYLLVSEAPAFRLLAAMEQINPNFAHFSLRQACGLGPVPNSAPVEAWLRAHKGSFASILDRDLRLAAKAYLSMAAGAPGVEHEADPAAYA